MEEPKMAGHNWQLDEAEELNPAKPTTTRVEQCATCGCYKITTNAYSITERTKVVYKPAEFTWNPFKTLKVEPPCPAKW